MPEFSNRTRYFLDTEFIEDGSTIDLISIGLVCEDGREMYLQNRDCHFPSANSWVRENVFPHLQNFDAENLKPIVLDGDSWRCSSEIGEYLQNDFCDVFSYGKPAFYTWYGAYDHVALCQMFGQMINLPKDWPMYTRDLKYIADILGDPELPKQLAGEHNALNDARWLRDVYGWLKAIAAAKKINVDF